MEAAKIVPMDEDDEEPEVGPSKKRKFREVVSEQMEFTELQGQYSPPHCLARVWRTTSGLPPNYHRKII